MNAIVGNQVASGIDALVDQIEMHRSGKTRILATSGADAQPAAALIGAHLRRGGPEGRGRHGLAAYAPAKTPAATIAQLNAAMNKALAHPEVRERMGKLGLEPTGGSAADVAALMVRDTERWAPVVKASGFKAD